MSRSGAPTQPDGVAICPAGQVLLDGASIPGSDWTSTRNGDRFDDFRTNTIGDPGDRAPIWRCGSGTDGHAEGRADRGRR